MYNNWTIDMSDSVAALDSIKDTVLPRLISGTIHSIENTDNEILMMLDAYSGIDYIRQDENGLQGIASRVQWGRSWDTFTIRAERYTGAETELDKRLYQIENGYFYPAYTLQAYFDNREDNNLLSIGVIRTVDLYMLFKNNNQIFKQRQSDNKFYFVNWTDLHPYIKSIHV